MRQKNLHFFFRNQLVPKRDNEEEREKKQKTPCKRLRKKHEDFKINWCFFLVYFWTQHKVPDDGMLRERESERKCENLLS